MARHLIALAAIGFLLTGCVAQEKYNAMKLEKDALAEHLGKAQSAESAARAAADAWKSQLDSILASGNDKDSLVRNQAQEIAALREQLASIKAKYEGVLNRPGPQVITLDPKLDQDLRELAAKFGPIMEYDATRGILRFKSDVTFASGSADLTPAARQAITAFANVLKSPAAQNYEFMVAGHTDSRPVSNPATRQRHPDNWYLSAHRAISVGESLITDGVNPRRLGVAGYGPERPIATNNTSEGQAKNRRVEVAILPNTYHGQDLAGGGTNSLTWDPRTTPKKATPKPGAGVNKDVVQTPTEEINK